MEVGKKRLLQKHTVMFVKLMNPDLLRPVLLEKRLLTRDEAERLALPGQTTNDKNMFIFTTLPTKGPKAFGLFIEALQQTMEEHIGHKELIDIIISDKDYK